MCHLLNVFICPLPLCPTAATLTAAPRLQWRPPPTHSDPSRTETCLLHSCTPLSPAQKEASPLSRAPNKPPGALPPVASLTSSPAQLLCVLMCAYPVPPAHPACNSRPQPEDQAPCSPLGRFLLPLSPRATSWRRSPSVLVQQPGALSAAVTPQAAPPCGSWRGRAVSSRTCGLQHPVQMLEEQSPKNRLLELDVWDSTGIKQKGTYTPHAGETPKPGPCVKPAPSQHPRRASQPNNSEHKEWMSFCFPKINQLFSRAKC